MNTEWLLGRDLESFDEEETFSKYGSQKCTGNEDEENSTDEEGLFQNNGFVGNEDEEGLDGSDEDDSSNSSSNDSLKEGCSSKYGLQKRTLNEDEESSTDKRDLLQSNGFVDNEDEEDLTNERSSEFSQLSCLNELSKNGSLEEMFSDNSFEIDNKVFEDYLEKLVGVLEQRTLSD
ncbi:hypothetical protein NE237_024695 [Protea cynaroides]|uniref:Uncharacterized protein n=1 Tax=Protea cynaroides TaxID=273540 RepID=A0A9Q0H1P1_9MAGN|nr:hypothetical protein NE237_024695 [Protea cynaroides]